MASSPQTPAGTATGAVGDAEPGASALPPLSTTALWFVLLLLATGVLISYVDRTSMSSAIAAESFKTHFGLTDLDKGWLNSAFFWSYGLVQIPMGYVVDRYGVKWPYAICFALWSVATALTGMMDALAGLIMMRFIIGAAEAIAIPASFRWVRDNFGDRHSGTAAGILAAGNKFGPAIGAPVAIWLINMHSWRIMFIATGIVGLIWLIPWLALTRNDFPKIEARAAKKRAASSVPMRNILVSPVVWGAMISNFCYGYFTFFCMQWMPDYLHNERGLSLESSGVYTFFSFAGIAIVAIIAGWAADRIIARGGDPVTTRKCFVVAGFVGACTVLLGVQTESLEMALFWNVFSLSSLGLATANNLALCRITLIPKPAVGLATGVQQVATSLAGGVAGALTGWLLHISNNNYDLPMMMIGVFLVIGALSTWVLMRRKWAPKVDVI
ncbi:MFS transporter [Novosphingobium flavum]|uniref:MFS transporter n=1 Tax=Novosphingobium flavum TaxID=1778672 RepID=A0A7X1FS59_9SPHN|nr:MFS transporter [Novosphingobium flavum]MBC2665991.1 MFS transporter [Novosphingobium flavum]